MSPAMRHRTEEEEYRYAWSFRDDNAAQESTLAALRDATTLRVSICRLPRSAVVTFEANIELAFFTRYCAHEVAGAWRMPDHVRTYITTGDPELRAVAHHSAWEQSCRLEGVARLAARTAMYAAFDGQLLLAAKEAMKLSMRVALAQSHAAAVVLAERQEHVLASSLLGHAYAMAA